MMQDLERLELIRRKALQEEMQKSGLEALWKKQLQWQKKVSEGIISEDKVDRYYWMMGREIFDDNGEYLDLDRGWISETGRSGFPS